MKNKYALPELLAPAGDMDALFAAVRAGADAIYVGGRRFGARAFAKNFDSEELIYAVRYCHSHGVRLYVTLNTLIFDKEISDALEYARFLHGIGVDALIVADLGVASLIRREVPGLELHASTQMGIHNTYGADEAYRMGISRVVLARECSGEDIGRITEGCLAECEVFVHGALCVCHSGQCLFSSLVGGRSGNRGECAQPCRLPYGKGYPLSLKDMSLATRVRELISLGVSSLKIEGRMKSPDYVYRVVSIYRRLLDENRNAEREENRALLDIFSRGGFTDGYFKGELSSMTGVRSEEEKRISRELSGGVYGKMRAPVSMNAVFKGGRESSLSVSLKVTDRWTGEEKTYSASASGQTPEAAINAPLSRAALTERLSKLGATDFEAREISLDMDEGLILPVSEINRLRREAIDGLLPLLGCAISSNVHDPIKQEKLAKFSGNVNKTAQFYNVLALKELIQKNGNALKFIDVSFVPLFDYPSLSEEERLLVTGVYLPPVVMEHELSRVREAIAIANECGAKYALLGNISHIGLLRGSSLMPIADQRMNVANSHTKEHLSSLGIEKDILSAELTLPMARDIGGGLTVMGRVALMTTERCFIKENFGCEKCGRAALTDRMGKRFPMMREWQHRNVIFNSVPTYMGDKRDELSAAGIRHEHFVFSSEGADKIEAMLTAYRHGAPLGTEVCRIKKRLDNKSDNKNGKR